MKSLPFKALLFCSLLALTSCNSSSNSAKTPAPAPLPQGPGDVNMDQFDANENSTEQLSTDDQEVAFASMTDVGRAYHVESKTQDANTPQTPGGQFVDTTHENPTQAKKEQPSYYDQDQLSQQIIAAVNNQQKCNPTVVGNQGAESVMKFTTTGAQCPMLITMQFNASVATSEQLTDVKATGSFKFAFNEKVLTKLKEQDLVSGDMTISTLMKMKTPDRKSVNQDMASSGSVEQSGKLVSKRLGQIEVSQKMVYAFEMKMVQNQMPQMISRAVAQVELKAMNKRAVFTVKMDSQAAEPVKCTLNKQPIDLQLCEEMINKLNLNDQGQKNAPAAGETENGPGGQFPG